MATISLSIAEARALAEQAFATHGIPEAVSVLVSDYLIRSEIDGQSGHGLMRVGSYLGQVKAGKIRKNAVASVNKRTSVAAVCDADNGFSYPAIKLALDFLKDSAATHGIAIAAVRRSHHFGQVGLHVESLAQSGLLGICVGNTPRAMAAHGGTKPFFGTNPIAFACPIPGTTYPMVIDLALSKVARGKIVRKKQEGESIPDDWAVDVDGKPTTDPAVALKGSLLAIGGAKGSALAMMVEVMSACLADSKLSIEADSLLDPGGTFPNIGHTFIAISPSLLAGEDEYQERMGTLLAEFKKAAPDARLPGIRRIALREKAAREGITITKIVHDELVELGNNGEKNE